MKKTISLLLALVLVFSLAPTVFAEGPPILTLSADKNSAQPGDTVTLTVTLDEAMSIGAIQFTLSYDASAYTCASFVCVDENLEEYGDTNNVLDPDTAEPIGEIRFIAYRQNGKAIEVGAGQLVTATFTATATSTGTFALTIANLNDTDAQPMTYELVGANLTIPVSTPFSGYTVSMGEDQIDVAANSDVLIPVTLGNTDESVTTYNAFDMTFSFDKDVLEAKDSGYDASIEVIANNETGTLRLKRYGETAQLSEPINLLFTAKASGTATVAFVEGKVDISEHAIFENAPPAAAADDGEVDITVTGTTEYTVTWEGSGVADITGEKPTTVAGGEDLVFTITAAAGYTYTVTSSCGEVSGTNGSYTVTGITEDVTITVEKTLNGTVKAYPYLELSGKSIYLITVTGDPGTGNVYKYDGNAMYEAANYGTGVYSYLVLVNEGEAALTDETAAVFVAVEAGSAAGTIAGGYDVNGTGKVDVNDAQLVYNMYTGKYDGFTDDVTMAKFLAADVNRDYGVDVNDAVAIVERAQ